MEETISKTISKIVTEQISQVYDNTLLKMEEVLGKFYSSTSDNIQYVTEWLNNSQHDSNFYNLIHLQLGKYSFFIVIEFLF